MMQNQKDRGYLSHITARDVTEAELEYFEERVAIMIESGKFEWEARMYALNQVKKGAISNGTN